MITLRCAYCHTPFVLRREEILAALRQMETGGQHHYDAHCPRCRRAMPISAQRLEKAYPGWRQALQQAAAEEKPGE